ncbi:MAG: hypothetical protein RIT28_5014 [Pseudomonadota bacterium]
MSLARLVFPLALLSAFTACGDKEVACTEEARSSVMLTLVDESDAPVVGASVIAATDSGDLDCEDWDATGVYVCGYEVSGAFVISIEAAGFESQEIELEVGLTEDECHVETVQETVVMVASAA